MPSLPSTVDRAFAGISARVRTQRSIRGYAILAIVGLVTAAVIVLLDFAFDLPKLVRCLLFLGWLGVLGLSFRQFVRRPLRVRVEDDALAGTIEAKYPNFSERLITLSSVQAGTGSGSPHLVSQLKREVEKRANIVEPDSTVSTRSAVRLAISAAFTVIVALVALAIVPGGPMRAKRFIVPWSDGAPPASFRVVVTSGEPLLRRGESFPITAYLERIRPTGELPKILPAMIKDSAGVLTTIQLVGDDRGAFHGVRPNVRDDFQYSVNLTRDVENWLQVKVADPVSLTDQTTTTIESPKYAQATFPGSQRAGFGEIELLQFSTVTWQFSFDRPAEGVAFEFLAASGRRDVLPIGVYKSVTWLARESGTLILTMTGERGIRTSLSAAVRVLPDQPPRFERVSGLANQGLEIKPGERMPIAISIADDIAVKALSLEYRVSDASEIKTLPIPATGLGTRFAEGRMTFDTAGICPAGKTILIRLRVDDNRTIAEPNLGPQTTFFPATEWLPLRVTASAKSLAEQQIFGQRDRITEALKASLESQNRSRQEIATVAGANTFQLSDDHLVKLKQARELLTEAVEAFKIAQREAGLIPELTPVAQEAAAITSGPIKSSDESIQSATTQAETSPRRAALQAAFRSTLDAVQRTEKLIVLNEQLAKRRLEQRLLSDLAREERDLADRLKNATTPEERAAIAAEQKALRERLNATVREHDGLRNQADAQAKANAAERAKTAEALKNEADQLDKRRQAAEQAAMTAKNSEFAAKQKKLSDDVAKATGANGESSRSANGAADRFAKGDSLGAMADQESAARQLEQYADGIEQAANARRDPKEAARQIALWQKDFAKRFGTMAKSIPYAQMPKNVQEQILKEAKSLRDAVNSISVPEAFAKKKAEAVKQAGEAITKMSTPQGESEFTAATKLTQELADRMPTKAERLKATKIEVSKLLDQQNDIAREFAEAKGKSEKLPGLALKEEALATKIAALDTPGHEPRRDRAGQLAKSVADDLRSVRAADAATGLLAVTKQLERLRQAVDGIEPVDDVLDRLARKQDDIANRIDKLSPNPTKAELDEIRQLQREVGRELASQSSGESPSLMRDAKDRVTKTEQALKDKPNPDVDELKKKSKESAQAMNQLADRMAGAESDADRINRLQRNRDQATAAAQQATGQPINPDASAAAKQAVQSDLDELNQSRVGEDDGKKAKAREALNRLKNVPDPDRQKELQKQAAEALAELGKSIKPEAKPMPRTAPNQPDFQKSTAPGLPTKDRATEARDLAAQQRALRDQASQAATQGSGVQGEAIRKAEGELAGKIGEFSKQLQADAESAAMSQSESGKALGESMNQAAAAANRAANQANRAVRESSAGRPDSANQARQETKRDLANAAQSLNDVSRVNAPDLTPGASPQNAAQSMAKAEQSMQGNRPDEAREQMNRAAEQLTGNDSLKQKGDAGNQVGPKSEQPTPATSIPLPPDLKKYEGVAWGDLPGDVRNRIVQELAAKYGDDYARSIKLYFEQLAESK